MDSEKVFPVKRNFFKFITNLHENIDSSEPTDAIFIAFAKAFDSLPHQLLL